MGRATVTPTAGKIAARIKWAAVGFFMFAMIISLRDIGRNPVIWGTAIGTFCYVYFVYYCMTSMPTYVGFQNTASNLAGIAAPWLTGWMVAQTGNFDVPIKAIGVWLVIGIASYIFLVREKFAPKLRRV